MDDMRGDDHSSRVAPSKRWKGGRLRHKARCGEYSQPCLALRQCASYLLCVMPADRYITKVGYIGRVYRITYQAENLVRLEMQVGRCCVGQIYEKGSEQFM